MDKIIAIFDSIGRFLDDFGIHIYLLIAGAFGSLLSLEDKQGLSGWQKVAVFVSGAAIANYIAPLIINENNNSRDVMGGFAFILGYSGLKGLKFVIIIIKKKWGVPHKEDK